VRRGPRYVRENDVQCIRRGLLLRERVHWEWAPEQEWRRRDRCALARVRALRREGRGRDMCREV